MTAQSATPSRASRRTLSPPSLYSSLVGTGFAVSIMILAAAAFQLIFGDEASSGGSSPLRVLLYFNIVIISGLAVGVGTRVARRLTGRRFGEPAPRLHLRFITMFTIAAAIPTILVAVFLGGVLTRGVEFWFGERVSAVVEGAATAAREVVEREAGEASEQMRLMSLDLSQPDAVTAFSNARIQYTQYLRQQTIVRGFRASYIVDGQGTVLARAETPDSPAFIPPSPRLYELARDGDIGVSSPEQANTDDASMRALMQLTAYEDAYLYVFLNIDLSVLQRAENAVVELRNAGQREAQLGPIYILVYLETALLIVLGAISLALGAATRIVRPVSNLVGAAERVRRGDLDARVEVKREDDEIATLGLAFNRMTRQLRGQRRELVASHAQSERRRAFTEAVLAGVTAGVIGLDEDNCVTLVNRSACALLERDEDMLVGHPIAEAAPALLSAVEAARRRPGEVTELQTEIEASDETPLTVSVRAAVTSDAGLVLTFDDISRLVAAQRNAAWRDVARRIAHEIKNPLTPIQLSAERLRRKYRKHVEEHDVETFDRCTDTIVRQVSDIGRMVDEFSSFARMPTPKVEPADMTSMVQSAVFAQRVASPDLKVEFTAPAAPVRALCDERLAVQALANILKNAAESVTARCDRDGGKAQPGRIAVELIIERGFAVIEVCDNGLGWPTPDRERLTEPYMTTREKGTGLGLAIVKRVMEDHQGRLELDVPDDGTGAIVRLFFPLAESDGGAAEPVETGA